MVVAYLRGLLKPEFKEGLRSRVAEQVVLSALAAEEAARNLVENIRLDHVMMPLLEAKSQKRMAETRGLRMARVNELRSMDIYAFSRSAQYANLSVIAGGKEISLVQLAHAMEEGGLLNLGLDQDVVEGNPEAQELSKVLPQNGKERVPGKNMSSAARKSLGLD